jgi:GT2 family glycosyltransferase
VIRDSLAVVVVTRRHPERLSKTLAALAADKVPGTVTVVNLTGDSVSLNGQSEIVGHRLSRCLTLWIAP